MGLNKDNELVYAATIGDIEAVREYMAFWGDPKYNDSEALRGAAKHGHAHVVELLLPVSDANACNAEALQMAALNGHAVCASLLVPHTRLNAECKLSNTGISVGQNALRLAAKRDCIEIVRELSVLCGEKGITRALEEAAYRGALKCVRYLLPIAQAGDRRRALWQACCGQQHQAIDLLFEPPTAQNVAASLLKHHPNRPELWQYLNDKIEGQRLHGALLSVIEIDNGGTVQRKM